MKYLTMCWHFWLAARECVLVLKPCRVSIVMVAAGLAFLVTAQGADVARALAEQRSGHTDNWNAFWFFTACLVWSVFAWYWARIMLLLKLPGVPRPVALTGVAGLERWLQALRVWVPRYLGLIAMLGVAAAFYRASREFPAGEESEVKDLLHYYAIGCVVGAAVFLSFVWRRRVWTRFVYDTVKNWTSLHNAFTRPLIDALNLPDVENEKFGELDFMRLGRLTRALLIGTLVSFAALFAIVVFGAPWTAAAFGSAALILLAAGGWTAVGSALDFIGMRLRVPIFIGLLLFAAVCSFWNDNHAVRTLAQDQPAHRSNLRASLEAWMARHEAKIKAGERVPFYVVNAEGGGIRAAYWTATVLGEIHRRSPQFSEHLFSVSGVSGGSLGASVFVALLAQSREDPTLDVKQAAQNILGEDFLSPVVASILYPDLVQRFLPFSVSRFDRGASLEQAWERAWAKYVPQRNRMMEPLDRLWENPKEWTPALFLNGTWVETGKRIVTSNLRVAATKDAEDFVDIEDAQAFFAPHALSLSTAAHMSARFTYVSPAGSLRRDGKIHGRVVDGGYFENSGATTTLEILQNIDFFFQTDKRWKEVDIYVIHISNEPVEAKYALDSLVTAPDNPHIKPHKGLNEVMSPLHALLKARDARGFYARESLMWRVGGEGYFFHFGLCQRNASVPLGWVLSQSARHQVDTELTQPKCIAAGAKNPVFNNPASFDTIEARLTPPSALSPAQRQ